MSLSRSALVGIFKRNGGPGRHTILWADASSDEKRFIEEKLRDRMLGEAVLVTQFAPDDWSLVTTKEIIVASGQSLQVIPISEIERVTPVRDKNGEATSKREWDTLHLHLRNAEGISLRTDPGETFSAMWNVLKSFESGPSSSDETAR